MTTHDRLESILTYVFATQEDMEARVREWQERSNLEDRVALKLLREVEPKVRALLDSMSTPGWSEMKAEYGQGYQNGLNACRNSIRLLTDRILDR